MGRWSDGNFIDVIISEGCRYTFVGALTIYVSFLLLNFIGNCLDLIHSDFQTR